MDLSFDRDWRIRPRLCWLFPYLASWSYSCRSNNLSSCLETCYSKYPISRLCISVRCFKRYLHIIFRSQQSFFDFNWMKISCAFLILLSPPVEDDLLVSSCCALVFLVLEFGDKVSHAISVLAAIWIIYMIIWGAHLHSIGDQEGPDVIYPCFTWRLNESFRKRLCEQRKFRITQEPFVDEQSANLLSGSFQSDHYGSDSSLKA